MISPALDPASPRLQPEALAPAGPAGTSGSSLWRRHRWALALRFALAPALAVLVLTLLLLGVVQLLPVAQGSQQALARVQLRAAVLGRELEADLQTALRSAQLLARSPRLVAPASPAVARLELEHLRADGSRLSWVGLTDLDGRVIAGTGGWHEGASVASQAAFRLGRRAAWVGDGAPGQGEPAGAVGDVPPALVSMGVPVRDDDGRVVAVLVAQMSVSWAERLRSRLAGERGPGAIRLHLLSGEGERDLLPGDPPPPAALRRVAFVDVLEAADGRRWFAASVPIGTPGRLPTLPWRVLALQARDDAIGPSLVLMQVMAVCGALVALAVGLLGYLHARSQLRPWAPLFEAVLGRGQGLPPGMSVGEAVSRWLKLHEAGRPRSDDAAARLLEQLADDARERGRLVEAVPVAIARLDAALRFVQLNPACTRLLGWTPERVRGRHAVDLVADPVAREELLRQLDRHGEAPGELVARFDAATATGERTWIQWHLVPLVGLDGRFDGAVVHVQDMRTERAARVRADALAGRLRALADAAVDDLLATLDADGRILEWSRGAERLSGLPAATALGRSLADLLHGPELLPAWLLEARRHGRCPVAAEVHTADGLVRWFEGSVYALGLAPGAARFGVMLRDLTAARDVHRALERSEARLRLALEAARLVAWEVDLQGRDGAGPWSDHHVDVVGAHGERLPRTLGGFYAQIDPRDQPVVEAAIARGLAEGVPVAAEYRVAQAGGLRWRAVRGRAQRDEAGRPLRLAGVGMDITERKQAEAAVQLERERLSQVVDTVDEAIVQVDDDGRLTLANAAAARLFGHAAATLVGMPLQRLLPSPPDGPVTSAPGVDVDAVPGPAPRATLGLPGLHAGGRALSLDATVTQARVGERLVRTMVLREHVDDDAAAASQGADPGADEPTQARDLQGFARRLLEQEQHTTRRLAQALQDEVGQTLTALRLHWEALRAGGADHRPGAVDRIGPLIATANRQVRGVIDELRPPLLDDFGLGAALDNEVAHQRAAEGPPEIRFEMASRLVQQRWPAEVEHAAFMVGREALVAALHQDDVRRIVVSVDGDAGELLLRVADDGRGLPVLAAVRAGLRARAAAVGAQLQMTCGAGRGTVVELRWAPADEPDLPDR